MSVGDMNAVTVTDTENTDNVWGYKLWVYQIYHDTADILDVVLPIVFVSVASA